ncbi:MAG: CHASE2 domain-containing protein [Fibrobacter sp.]|mgnify:CR=1 FL=1|nr:CHASE2 domain-containing protein [Fibrobacter sp.]
MKKNYTFLYLLLSTGLTLFFISLYVYGTFTWFDLKVFDFAMKYLDQGRTDSNIVIIEYDDKTAENQHDPVTTGDIINLIQQIQKENPSVIAIDNFSVYGKSSDSVSSDSLKDYHNISLGIGLSVPVYEQESDSLHTSFDDIRSYCTSVDINSGVDFYTADKVFSGAITRNTNASSAGHLVLYPDADGVFRRIPAMIQCGDGFLFSFGIQAAFDYLGITKNGITVGDNSVNSKKLRINQNGLMLIRFQNHESSIKTISMIDILTAIKTDTFSSHYQSFFRDKLVFIGNSSIRTARFCSTPVNPYIPSIRLHAIVASNVITDTVLFDTNRITTIILLLIIGLSLSWLMFTIKSLRFVGVLSGILPLLVIGGFFIIQSGINVPLFTITFFTASLYLFLTIYRHLHYKDMLLDKLHLLQNEMRMKERLVTIGEMSSKVAHEIRNPLNAIQLHLSLLKRKQATGNVDEFIDVIHEESERLNRYITSLLQFGRPLVLTIKKINVIEEINSIKKLLAPELNNKAIDIQIRHEVTDLIIAADGDQLREVFINIIKNSVESIDDGGMIHIRTFLKKDIFFIEFADNGKGIPQDIVDKIFTPFFTTKKHGTGLGLAIVRKIIEAHHGTIEINSTVGKGTSIAIGIPVEA